MKVVCLLGSPREKGNSELLVDEVVAPLRERGAEVTTHRLNSLKYRGCQACMACKTSSEACVLKDDLTPVLADVRAADVVVFASPVYYGDVTGQMKCFVDRSFEFLVPEFINTDKPSRLAPGKRSVIVLTQAAAEEQFADVFGRYKGFLEFYGFREVHQGRACGAYAKGAVAENGKALQRARTVGEALAAGD